MQPQQSHTGGERGCFFGKSTQPCPPATVWSEGFCFVPPKIWKDQPQLQRKEWNDLWKAQSQVLSRAGGGIWGFHSPSSILAPVQHCAKNMDKALREFREAKLSSFSLSLECSLNSMGRAVSCSSPAQRNGMCWKVWSTQETCKIKTSNHQYLSKQKNKEGKKRINPVTLKNAISGIPSAAFDGIHAHVVLFVKKSRIKIKDNPGIWT